MVLFLRVLLEPVGDRVGDGLAGPSTHLILRFLFPATVPDVPLIHDVQKGRKFPRIVVKTVHTVGNSDKPNTLLPKQDFRIKSCLQVISPDPAHVLGDHAADLPGLNVRHKPFPTGPLKIGPAPSVIRVMDAICETMLGGVAFQHGLLIHD